MNSRSDQDLLREYAERRSEAAFTELVRRHVDLVHSAALRMVKDPHLAEDVTQSVFIAFGQNARQLTDRDVFAGWLHRTTLNLAAKLVRTEMRRRAHEQEAVAMNESSTAQPEPAWEQVAPHLDAALGELDDADRDALLLRYFQHKTAREIAEAFSLSEEAAQKRVTRALEKLRGVFAARGVSVTASALAALLATQAVQTAPAALAAMAATATLAAGSVSTVPLSLMTSAKLQLGIAAALIAGLVAPLVVQHQQLKRLRSDHAMLVEQMSELDSLRAENERLAGQRTDTNELVRLREDQLDLLRLRAEVTRLGNELRSRQATPVIASVTNAVTPVKQPDQPGSFSYQGFATATVLDGATFAMGGWKSADGRRAFLFVTPYLGSESDLPADSPAAQARKLLVQASEAWIPKSEGPPGPPQVTLKSKLVEFNEKDLSDALLIKLAAVKNLGTPELPDAAPVFLPGSADFDALKQRMEDQGGTNVTVVTFPTLTTRDGSPGRISVGKQVPILGKSGNLETTAIGGGGGGVSGGNNNGGGFGFGGGHNGMGAGGGNGTSAQMGGTPAPGGGGGGAAHFVGTATIDLVSRVTPDGKSFSVEAKVFFVPPESSLASEP